jgi:hypothetical protein
VCESACRSPMLPEALVASSLGLGARVRQTAHPCPTKTAQSSSTSRSTVPTMPEPHCAVLMRLAPPLLTKLLTLWWLAVLASLAQELSP